MALGNGFLKKLRMVTDDSEDDYDDYDDYDEYNDDEKSEKEEKKSVFRRDRKEPEEPKEDLSPKSAYSVPDLPTEKKPGKVIGLHTGNSGSVCLIVPRSYDDANAIADTLIQHKAVVLNLESTEMSAAQRIIDFASGACYTVGGNLQKISKKIFIVAPSDMDLSGDFSELLESVSLNSVDMMK